MTRLLTVVAEALFRRAILSNMTIWMTSDWKNERQYRKNLQIPQLKHPFLEN